MKSFVIACVASATVAADGVPTAVFHGMGDLCKNPGMISLTRSIEKGVGAYAHCVPGIGSIKSFITTMNSQAKTACEYINSNEHFQGEFNVVGLS